MENEINSNRKKEIKSLLDANVDEQTLASFPSASVSPKNERRNRLGQALLVIGVFSAVAGLYIPSTDLFGRAKFLLLGFVFSMIGAWHIDHANKQICGGINKFKSKISARRGIFR